MAIAGGVASRSVPVSSPSAPGRAPTAPSYEHNPPLLDAAPRPRALAPSRRKFEWTAETAFLMASIGGLVAICVLLRTQDGALLTEWTLPLSLNTFLALLSLLSRSSLAYCMTSSLGQEKWNKFRRQASPMADFVAIEEASHGPMGSLALLWWSKLRYVASGTCNRTFYTDIFRALKTRAARHVGRFSDHPAVGRRPFHPSPGIL